MPLTDAETHEVLRALGRIEATLESISPKIAEIDTALAAHIIDDGKAFSELEKWKYKILLAIASASIGGGAVAASAKSVLAALIGQ